MEPDESSHSSPERVKWGREREEAAYSRGVTLERDVIHGIWGTHAGLRAGIRHRSRGTCGKGENGAGIL